MENRFITIIVAVIGLTFAFFVFRFIAGTVATLGSRPLVPAEGCINCITAIDSGALYRIDPATRFSLLLDRTLYPERNTVIVPPTVLGQVFGSSSPDASLWIKTFEALRPGTVEITVPSSTSTVADFRVTIRVAGSGTAMVDREKVVQTQGAAHIVGDRPSPDFLERGVVSQDPSTGLWHLSYRKNGGTETARLNFSDDSVCSKPGESGLFDCEDVVWRDGATVRVEGWRSGSSVIVYRFTIYS